MTANQAAKVLDLISKALSAQEVADEVAAIEAKDPSSKDVTVTVPMDTAQIVRFIAAIARSANRTKAQRLGQKKSVRIAVPESVAPLIRMIVSARLCRSSE
jgi:hypothetical protein